MPSEAKAGRASAPHAPALTLKMSGLFPGGSSSRDVARRMRRVSQTADRPCGRRAAPPPASYLVCAAGLETPELEGSGVNPQPSPKRQTTRLERAHARTHTHPSVCAGPALGKRVQTARGDVSPRTELRGSRMRKTTPGPPAQAALRPTGKMKGNKMTFPGSLEQSAGASGLEAPPLAPPPLSKISLLTLLEKGKWGVALQHQAPKRPWVCFAEKLRDRLKFCWAGAGPRCSWRVSHGSASGKSPICLRHGGRLLEGGERGQGQ